MLGRGRLCEEKSRRDPAVSPAKTITSYGDVMTISDGDTPSRIQSPDFINTHHFISCHHNHQMLHIKYSPRSCWLLLSSKRLGMNVCHNFQLSFGPDLLADLLPFVTRIYRPIAVLGPLKLSSDRRPPSSLAPPPQWPSNIISSSPNATPEPRQRPARCRTPVFAFVFHAPPVRAVAICFLCVLFARTNTKRSRANRTRQ